MSLRFRSFAVLVVFVLLATASPASAIYAGNDADVSEYPWMVSLHVQRDGSWTHNCGGTLINSEWVLTAAHCVYDFDLGRFMFPAELQVAIGDERPWSSNDLGKVTEIKPYVAADGSIFDGTSWHNDLALVSLFDFVYDVRPIDLAFGSGLAAGTDVRSIGWGSIGDQFSDRRAPAQLQYLDLTIRDDADCEFRDDDDAAAQLCSKDPRDQNPVTPIVGGPRPGDSGGPLLLQGQRGWVQVGVASHLPKVENPLAKPSWFGTFIDGDPNLTGWMSVGHARDWIVQESPLRRANVSTALIVDSSGSMTGSDPQNRRLDAGEAYLVAAERDDEVGVVDFDGRAQILANPLQVGPYREDLVSAIRQINSSGGTDLGAGLQAGCDLLQESQGYLQAAIFLTDGSGAYSNQAACFAERGWPVYAFGLGSGANAQLLEQIATETGGYYRQLDSATNLVCEFQQVRAAIVGQSPQSCEPTGTIELDETIEFFFDLLRGLSQVTFTNSWLGSDIEMTLVSPSGRTFDRSTIADDVVVLHGSTYETFTIRDPEPGLWKINLFGADIPEGGEPYTFSTVSIENPDSDGDGVPNSDDAYPDSDMSEYVHVAGQVTAVPSLVLADGATFNDLIATEVEQARNRGALVSAVAELARGWKRAEFISGRQSGEIKSAAAKI